MEINRKLIMITYSYNDIEEISKKLAKVINENYGPSMPNLLTFTKGGTFASAFISKYLSWKPTIISLGTDFTILNNQPFIVVDDILDTGNTVKCLNDMTDNFSGNDVFHYFLIYKHTSNKIWMPKYSYVQEIVKDDWVVFPWETYEAN